MSEIKDYPNTDRSIIELYKKFDKSIDINWPTRKSKEFRDHFEKYDYIKHHSLNQGQFFLYEEFISPNSNKALILYPKIGIFLHCYVIDMALGVEYVNYRRSWENHRQFDYPSASGRDLNSEDYSQLKSIIRETILWNDNLLIYGVWDKLPDFKTLKEAYTKTWWFHKTIQEKREIKINSINGQK